ncbi:MAG: kinase, partial [Blastocatellia bacterium]
MTEAREQISTLDPEELNRKIAQAPEWGDANHPIQTIQTHISTVFLGQKHVLKTKKPVDFGFLDYTTLERRLRACRAEVELNRRLCRDVYLGVQPISEVEGDIHLSRQGRILDYGVLMSRLPANRMLDHMVADGAVTESIIERVCKKLCLFHLNARRGKEIEQFGRIEMIRQNWRENFDQTLPYAGRTINRDYFDSIERWVWRTIEEKADVFEDRVKSGWIRDGHGDVRCESVCITGDEFQNQIVIFDCIEFNDRFRYADVASEVAFLSMDLDIR